MARVLLKPTDTPSFLDLTTRLGVPFVILLIILWQLTPRIDKQTEISERTSAYLQVLTTRAPQCGPVSSAIVGIFPT